MISLPVLGPNILFPYGLAIGTCVAIIALNIISFTVGQAAESGKRKPVVIGFIIRILFYGGVLYLAVSTSVLSLTGAAIGLVLPHIAMYIMYGLVPAVRRRTKKEPAPAWIADTRSMMFLKEPYFIKTNRGRTYLTHRHYRKIRVYNDGT